MVIDCSFASNNLSFRSETSENQEVQAFVRHIAPQVGRVIKFESTYFVDGGVFFVDPPPEWFKDNK
jgi:hypothetical protein